MCCACAQVYSARLVGVSCTWVWPGLQINIVLATCSVFTLRNQFRRNSSVLYKSPFDIKLWHQTEEHVSFVAHRPQEQSAVLFYLSWAVPTILFADVFCKLLLSVKWCLMFWPIGLHQSQSRDVMQVTTMCHSYMIYIRHIRLFIIGGSSLAEKVSRAGELEIIRSLVHSWWPRFLV